MPMNLSKDLVPIISKKDMDIEAAKFLEKYCPAALEKPMPIPVEDIAEFKMGLEIDYANLDKNCDTLGMVLFSNGMVELYDKETKKYFKRPYEKGTIASSGEKKPSPSQRCLTPPDLCRKRTNTATSGFWTSQVAYQRN